MSEEIVTTITPEKKKEKFSYSKIEVFEQCKYKYKLVYTDKHFIHSDSVANEFGTLIHYIEETMAKKIINNEPLNSQELISLMYNIDLHTKEDNVLGVLKLKEKYPKEWYEKDKTNKNYEDKVNDYINNGIFRLYSYLMNFPNLEIVGVEQPFKVEIGDAVFSGFIDRVFRDKVTGELYIEDIKTWKELLPEEKTKTPLQFVIYVLAAMQIYGVTEEDKIHCAYELPLIDQKQFVGSKGFMKRGQTKINKILAEIDCGDFKPSPSPLCYWCAFSKTMPNQPEEAKNLCPYYCNWTKDKADFSKAFEWMGPANHDAILKQFIENELNPPKPVAKINVNTLDTRRYFIIRRS